MPRFSAGEQVFAPVVGDAVALALPDEKADDLDRLAFQRALAAERDARGVFLVAHPERGGQHAVIGVGGVDHGATGGAADCENVFRACLQRRAAARAAEDLRLDGRRRDRHAFAQVVHLQRLELDRLADEEQRRRFRIIEGREIGPVSEVDRSNRITGADLERQLALAGHALGVFDIADGPRLAGQHEALADLQASECRQRLHDVLHEGEHVLAARLRQPAGAHVVEQQVPLVPVALAVLDLDAPDQREMHALVAAFGAQLQRRAVLDQRRHLADVFQRLVVADQRALAIVADGEDRRRRLEDDRRAAGRTGGSQRHRLPIRSVF